MSSRRDPDFENRAARRGGTIERRLKIVGRCRPTRTMPASHTRATNVQNRSEACRSQVDRSLVD